MIPIFRRHKNRPNIDFLQDVSDSLDFERPHPQLPRTPFLLVPSYSLDILHNPHDILRDNGTTLGDEEHHILRCPVKDY